MNRVKEKFTLDVVLHEPEIPGNTGTTARTCAALGCRLHLIEPLGFSLEEKYVRRAGLDYWHLVDVSVHSNWETFYRQHQSGRFFFISKTSQIHYHRADFRGGPVYVVFGKETMWLPPHLIDGSLGQSLRIPMREDARSLNLSNAVSIVMYEAFRQNVFPGLI